MGIRGPKAPPFDQRYIRDPVSGCWLWNGHTDKDGYGRLTHLGHNNLGAHRLSWMLHRGEIPDRMCVLHKCDVRACVNPDHLFLGSFGDNARDREVKRRGALARDGQAGDKNHMAKLTTEDVLKIRIDPRVHHEIAKDYGVRRQAIDKIKNGQRWGHL